MGGSPQKYEQVPQPVMERAVIVHEKIGAEGVEKSFAHDARQCGNGKVADHWSSHENNGPSHGEIGDQG